MGRAEWAAFEARLAGRLGPLGLFTTAGAVRLCEAEPARRDLPTAILRGVRMEPLLSF